jgi:hypothetical protein
LDRNLRAFQACAENQGDADSAELKPISSHATA